MNDTPPEERPLTELTLELANDVAATYDTYVVFPSREARDAATLWTMHAYVYAAFGSTGRLLINSVEYGSGKTRVLEVLEQLVPNPVLGIDLTPPVLWRLLEHYSPTILVDEADTVFGKAGSSSSHRILRSIINSGYRKGAKVPRTVGTEDVKLFHVFGPIAIAGVGKLPDSIRSRGIEIRMRKARKDELTRIEPFEVEQALPRLEPLRERLENWSVRAVKALRVVRPDLPVTDRDADIWRPLVAVAHLAGGDWPERAIRACVRLTTERAEKDAPVGVKLLSDIRMIFGARANLFTRDLLTKLHELEESDWTGLDARQLARILRDYDIKAGTVRQGAITGSGYKAADFHDTWERYL